MQPSILYVKGDASQPQGTGNRIITHCCNNQGYWNAGFVKALSRRWPEAERAYRRWAETHDEQNPFALGRVQFIRVAPGLCVANMIGQAGIRARNSDAPPPIRYYALQEGFLRVRELALAHNASVHMPRMGAGLAGGNWERISEIIENQLCNYGISVTVYDLKQD
jgi:O-acetyl-ADP-ribose deacetylase (regulator of RNase III)